MHTSVGDEGRTNFTLRVELACIVSGRSRVERSIFLFQYPVVLIIAAGVEELVGDGVVVYFLAVSIAKH